jgi:DNA-binding GntR family transcriptional regulator
MTLQSALQAGPARLAQLASHLPSMSPFRSLSEHVYLLLEEAIIQGQLPPGTHLQAEVLAEQFEMSRIPVREALRALQAHGWVVIRPRRGAFVREQSETEASELFQVRAVLEGQAARWGAGQRTQEQLVLLSRIVQAGTRAARINDLRQMSSLNTEFHAQLAICGQNAILAELLVSISKRIQWYFSAVATNRGLASWHEHKEIVNALRVREAERAATLCLHHSEATRSALHRRFAG